MKGMPTRGNIAHPVGNEVSRWAERSDRSEIQVPYQRRRYGISVLIDH